MVLHIYTQLKNPQEVQISELLFVSPLKKNLTAQLNKKNFYTIKNVVNSLLSQVEINFEKEVCAECVNFF